jgi:galactokinase
MSIARLAARDIQKGAYDEIFNTLYWPDEKTVSRQRGRYTGAIDSFERHYGADRDISIYSVPGRAELCGNHTDHNNGVVLASAVNIDIIAVVSKSSDGVIRLRSRGFGREDAVGLDELSPDEREFGSSSAIIRGVAAAFRDRGGKYGALDAYTTSDVLRGSGLSSSAAFEVCVGSILNGEYNEGRFDAVTLAMIGQYSENEFFGKPSGLMDQTACSVGGTVFIDFENHASPLVEKVPLDLASSDIYLVVTDTKSDHSDLTEEYGAIRREMESVAAYFGKKCLRAVKYEDFMSGVADVRRRAGDRAIVRAIHFFEECRRVREAVSAARDGDMRRWLSIMGESGHSSFEFNQNAYSVKTPERQGIPVGLAVSAAILGGRGACRLQGGGFAGAIQAFVPGDLLDEYCGTMRKVFGGDACRVLNVRPRGEIRIL